MISKFVAYSRDDFPVCHFKDDVALLIFILVYNAGPLLRLEKEHCWDLNVYVRRWDVYLNRMLFLNLYPCSEVRLFHTNAINRKIKKSTS